MKIIVLLGGASPERLVSISSGCGIAKSLLELKQNVICYDPAINKSFEFTNNLEKILSDSDYRDEQDPESIEYLFASLNKIKQHIKPDLVFNALHGGYGEDGLVQDLMERLKIPYTGSMPLACRLSMNKSISKQIMINHDIPTAAWQIVKKESYKKDSFQLKLPLPVIVKPNNGGSSVALKKVSVIEDLLPAISESFEVDSEVMIEEFVNGRELTVSILGAEAYPIVEIRPKNNLYDYECKYTKGMSEYIVPAPVDKKLTLDLQELALKCYNALQMSVYGRIDFLVTEEKEIYCLEANTLPGMTETSLVPKSVNAQGMDFNSLVAKIVKLSLNK